MTRPVAQLSDKSRVNSSSYRNEALASHGGSQVLNVAPQTERNPGHSGAMADASKAADAVDATDRQSFSWPRRATDPPQHSPATQPAYRLF